MGQNKTIRRTGTWDPSWGYSLQASASMALNPTTDTKRSGSNYWVTGSLRVSAGTALFRSASWANVGTQANLSASIATGSIAKVAIPISELNPSFNSLLIDSNDVKGLRILNYNGVVSNIDGYNSFSSSTFNGTAQTHAVIYVSASRANMGNVAGKDLILDLGTVQLKS
jgi:hypothetical protein